jgi:hydrogenase maturation protein HypF
MKIFFKGIVQGVGFRPTVYRIAKELGINGYVLNKGSEVEVAVDKNADEFIKTLKDQLPSIARIDSVEKYTDSKTYNDFKILHSTEGSRHSQIPVDVGICDKCLEELFDKNNRRYGFPFTNCTVCGARYSLIKDVPYDRERTSMNKFNLCKKCQEEYKNPLNRRYHAQTISCPECGPKYSIFDKNKKNLGSKDSIEKFAEYIDSESIGVIKSWGGMHLCCNTSEISRFRKWYNRPQKAFAIMVKDIDYAEEIADINKKEKDLLMSKEHPIVLGRKKKFEEASPGLDTIGVFLPYTGLHHLLFSFLKTNSLVMTSANIPGEAMITKNKDAFSINADCYLLHNRVIPNRVDDSVVRIWKNNRFFLRKSRGFVPDPVEVSYDKHILSVGAGQNITGAFSSDKKIFATQYIGNAKYYSTIKFLEQALRHLMKLTMEKTGIDAVVMDSHPDYGTRQVAEKFSEEFDVDLYKIQHHWAHAAALMLENRIDESVVLSLDGLGYGDDGNFWGGEILKSSFENYERTGHLEYIPMIGGDKATKDPRRLVFAVFQKFGKNKFFKDEEAELLAKIMDKSPVSSSLGRVLDALSCYLGICCTRTYDGEPAMKLEKYLSMGKPVYSFNVESKNGVVGTVDLFRQLDEKIKKELSEQEKANLAISFVKTIIDEMTCIAIESAEKNDIKNIGITGGVSYNIPITEMVEKQVKKYNLNFCVHDRIPNGDGGISVGQNVIIGKRVSK